MSRKSAEFWWNLPINESVFIEKNLTPPNRQKKFVCPENVAYYERDVNGWKEITWDDVFDKRKEKQVTSLDSKRRITDNYEYWKPVIVHIFDNQGSNFFGGIYIVITALGNKDIYLNFPRFEIREDLMIRLMELFPFVIPAKEFMDQWVQEFIRTFKTSSKIRPEAKKVIWAKYRGHRIIDFKIKKTNESIFKLLHCRQKRT